MRRIVVAVLVVMSALAVGGQANAAVATDPDTSCATADQLFCQWDQPSRAEGPYFINYVGTAGTDGHQQFCRLNRQTGHVLGNDCRDYWPFVNPTINADRAPASAFTADRLVASRGKVDDLRAELAKARASVTARERVIARQSDRIARLEARVARLRHRLAAR